MEITICKIGNSVGVIMPSELKAEIGDKYKIIELDDTIVMTPLRDSLFAKKADWAGFRDSVSKEDYEWDEK